VLADLRVLDCTDESGFLAGKILGDLGADVVKVEPPGGDAAGRRPPYLAGVADRERSLSWLALNTSKRGITLDLERAAGRAAFARLLAWADVLLDTFPPGALEAWELGWDALHARHPRLVRCAITPYGQTGPYANHRARDLVVVAMGGNAAMTGDPDRAPLRCTMPTAYYHAAPEAALGILMALQARAASGAGQLVDVSLQEVQLGTLLGGPGMHANGAPAPQRTGARPRAPYNDAREVLTEPQLRARSFFTTIDYPSLGASIEHPDFFAMASRGAVAIRRPAPRVGEHNDAVYREAGFTREELEKLAAEGAV